MITPLSVERTWTGAVSSDWLNDGNWNPRGIPAPGDTVNFGSGSISFSSPVNFSGVVRWSAGTFNSGRLVLSEESTLEISGSAPKDIATASIENHGRIHWSGPGRIAWTFIGGSLVNHPGATIEITGDAALESHYGNGGSITNLGTILKSAGDSTNPIYGALHNDGVIEARSGTLVFHGGGSGSGEFRAVNTARNQFQSGAFSWKGARFSGSGTNQVVGPVTLNGSLISSNFEIAPGASITGDFSISGNAAWTGGTLQSGQFGIEEAGALSIVGVAGKDISTGSIQNHGRIHWSGPGRIAWIFVGGSLVNHPGATIEITGDAALEAHYGNGGSITNLGTILKSAGDSANPIHGPLHNDGVIETHSGALVFHGGGSGSGEFRAVNTARNQFQSGAYSWDGARFSGSGTNQVVGPVTLNGSLISSNFEIASGASITGDFSISGNAAWTGGTFQSGQFGIEEAGALSIVGVAGKDISTGSIQNHGRIHWSGPGRIAWTFIGGSLVNHPGATIEITGDAALESHYGVGGSITNLGTILKSAGDSANPIHGPLHNDGVIEARSGTLVFHGGGSGSGEFRAVNTARNQFQSGAFSWDGARFSGSGTNQVVGPVTLNGSLTSSNFEIAPGASVTSDISISGNAAWAGGTLQSGQLAIQEEGALNIVGVAAKDISTASIQNRGRIHWSGSGRIAWIFVGGSLVNHPGATIEITGDAALETHYGVGGSITNRGTILKSAGDSVNPIHGALHNDGVIETHSGALIFHGGGSGSGEFRAVNTARNQFQSGAYSWDGARFTGSGTNQVVGPVTLNGSLTSSNFEIAPGASVTADISISGNAAWAGGTLQSGQLAIQEGGALNIVGVAAKDISTASIHNHGRIHWSGSGRIAWTFIGGSLVNHPGATIEITGDAALESHYGDGGSITNLGRIVKTTGSGMTVFQGPLDNDGEIDVAAGVLRFTGNVTLRPESILSFGLGGLEPGTEHGKILFDRPVTAQGAITARLMRGFIPEPESEFAVLGAPNLSGTFITQQIDLPAAARSLKLEYSTDGLVLRALSAAIQPALSGAWTSEGFRFTFTGEPGLAYRIEVSSDLIDWTTLSTVVMTAAPADILDGDSLKHPSRFYRILQLSAPAP